VSGVAPWWAHETGCQYAVFNDEHGNPQKAWVTNGKEVVFGKVDAFKNGNPQLRTPKKKPSLADKLNKGYVEYSKHGFLTMIGYEESVAPQPSAPKKADKVWQPPTKAKSFGGVLNF